MGGRVIRVTSKDWVLRVVCDAGKRLDGVQGKLVSTLDKNMDPFKDKPYLINTNLPV